MLKKVGPTAEEGFGNDRAMTPRMAGFLVMFFLSIGIFVSACAIRIDWILHRSKSWTQVEGQVISVKRVGNHRKLTYTYQFIANGKTETSTNIEPGPDSGQYSLSEGERIEVRHSPGANPYAFLKKTDIKTIILFHAMGFGWLVVGGVGLFGLVHGPLWRKKRGDNQPPSNGNVP